MSIAKTVEITAESSKGFEDAIQHGLSRAGKTIKNVKSAWVKDQQVDLQDGSISSYRVSLKVTFVLD